MNWKCGKKGVCANLMQYPAFTWREQAKPRTFSVSIVDIPAEIRIGHLSNIRQKLTALYGVFPQIYNVFRFSTSELQVQIGAVLLITVNTRGE
jgi:hypothetical protein